LHTLDWLILGLYFLLMLAVGFWARARVKTAEDFFTAGGKMPWWLSGISHHMSGYSSAVFVAYAAIAYTNGFTVYVWWAFSISVALLIGSRIFAPRWASLRICNHVISPLEYLAVRYNRPTQQLLAWSGSLLKVFDVGAKWSASAVLLQVFAGVPIEYGVLLTGGVTLVYSVVGGLWADALTDLGQFLIQLVAGLTMLIAVLHRLGGISAIWTIWSKLPTTHGRPFAGDYTALFAAAFFGINFLSYNGGTWNLAQRFMAAPTPAQARRSALLSAALYLFWPLVLFFPMWAAPLLLPHLADPSQSYAMLTRTLLPSGLVGLVLAGLFAHSMAMTSSDANAIAAVTVRDIIPALRSPKHTLSDSVQLRLGRVCTFCFLGLSMIIALAAGRFGGVIGLLILWYGALLGPTALPMILGMLRRFHRSGPAAAILSWLAGAVTYGLLKLLPPERWLPAGSHLSVALLVGLPITVSFFTYLLFGMLLPWNSSASEALLLSLSIESSGARELQTQFIERHFSASYD
jgi:SSS family solute:Na+ symporter